MDTKLYFDGACGPKNPGGHAGWGVMIENNTETFMEHGYIGHGQGMTNNVAEYTAVIRGLECLHKRGWTHQVEVYGDSRLVIEQLKGNWKINATLIKPLWKEAQKLMQEFTNITFQWIPREQNKAADKQSKLGLKIGPEI